MTNKDNANLRTELIKSTFNDFNKSKLDLLNHFYSEDVEFIDPVGAHKGLASLKKYYAHVYQNVIDIKFHFHEINAIGDTFYTKWTMTLAVKGLHQSQPYDTDGLSVIQFNSSNKVIYHRDYVDLGCMVYEKIPVLGKVIQLIKKKLG